MKSEARQQMLLMPCPHPLSRSCSVDAHGFAHTSELMALEAALTQLPCCCSGATQRFAACSQPDATQYWVPVDHSKNLLMNILFSGFFPVPSYSPTAISWDPFPTQLQALKTLICQNQTSVKVWKLPGKGLPSGKSCSKVYVLPSPPSCPSKVEIHNTTKTSKQQQQR